MTRLLLLIWLIVGGTSTGQVLVGAETDKADATTVYPIPAYSAILKNGVLTLENSCIRRQYCWNDGHLISLSIHDKLGKKTWTLTARKPDFSVPDLPETVSEGAFQVAEIPASPMVPAHLEAEVTCRLGGLRVKRVFRLYKDCPVEPSFQGTKESAS